MSEFMQGFLAGIGAALVIELLAAAIIVVVLSARCKPKTLEQLFGRGG